MAKTIRTFLLLLAGLAAAPVSGLAQGIGTFGVPWSAAPDQVLLDEADVAHLSASRTQDFERVGEQSDRLCQDLRVRAMMAGDPHERVLRSSDLIMAHLRASTFNRFAFEELTADRRAGMFDGFGNRGLALQYGGTAAAGPRDFALTEEDEPLPYDCQ